MRKYAKKGAKRPVRKFVRRNTVPRKSIAKVVKSTIMKMAEVKQQNYTFNMSLVAYPNALWQNTVIPCTPYGGFLEITQDAGQGSRIGNSIQVKKLWLSGILFPKPYNVATNIIPKPVEVKFIFYRVKVSPTILSTTLAGLYQEGGVERDTQQNLLDQIMPFNKDRYTILKTKSFKIGFSSFGGTAGQITNQYFANNDFKLNTKFNIDLTSICPKHIKYNDNAYTPQTNIIQLAMIWSYADGTQLVELSQPLAGAFSLNISYIDI